jgi:hypothetical protein
MPLTHILQVLSSNSGQDTITFFFIFLEILQANSGKKFHSTSHVGTEGEYRYSSSLSLTFVRDGVGDQLQASTAILPEKNPIPIVQKAGRPYGRSGRLQKFSPPPAFDPRFTIPATHSRPTASQMSHYPFLPYLFN